MNLTHTVKTHILEELKNGNTEVLKGLPPVVAMQYGLAMQIETGYKEQSPINDIEVSKSLVNRLNDGSVKEQLTKQIEQEEKERAEKVALAEQITKEVTGS